MRLPKKIFFFSIISTIFIFIKPQPSIAITLDNRLGVPIAAPAYPDRHQQQDLLSFASHKAYNLGFRSIELWLHPNVCNTHLSKPSIDPYGFYQTTKWCTANGQFKQPSLAWLASQPEFKKVFSLPFSTFFITMDSLNPQSLNQRKVARLNRIANQNEIDSLYRDVYQLTRYLIEQYGKTQKTFILTNGNELDWSLTAKNHCIPNCENIPADPISIKNAILWINTTHQAIEDAKKQSPKTQLKIWHSVEINKTLNHQLATAITKVIPNSHQDLVGWSAYEINFWLKQNKDVPKLFINQLNYLANLTPDSSNFGNRNIYISEIGFQENKITGSHIYTNLTTLINSAFKWHMPYFVYWELYDNNCQRFLPTNNQCVGNWIIRPDGTESNIYTKVLSKYVIKKSNFPGDLNHDLIVDILDYNLLLQKYNHPYSINDYQNIIKYFGKNYRKNH